MSVPGSRFRRSALTFAAGSAGPLSATAVGFVATPILLRSIGGERFGMVRAASDWFGYVGLLEFGVGGALQAVFARAAGTEDATAVVAGVRAGARAYVRLATLMLATSVALAAAMPWLIRAPEELRREVYLGCAVFAAGYLLVPLAVFRPLAESEQRGYLVHVLNSAQLITVTVASVAAGVAGWGLPGQFLALVAGSALFHLTLAWDGLRRHPEVLEAPSGRSPRLWSLSWPNLVFNLTGRLGVYTDNIIMTAFLGPAAVTSFVLTQRLIQAAATQTMAIGGAGWAGLMDLYYKGEREAFARRLVQMTRLTSIVGAATLLPLALRNGDLIGIWVGAGRYAGAAVTWLAAFDAWGLAIVALWGWPMNTSGRVRILLPTQLAAAGVNLAVSLGATAMWGAPGPLLGTAVAVVGVSWWRLLEHLRREFGIQPRLLARAALKPLLVAAPYGICLSLLPGLDGSAFSGWRGWTAWAAMAGWLSAAAAGYVVLAAAFAVPADDRREWIGRLRLGRSVRGPIPATPSSNRMAQFNGEAAR